MKNLEERCIELDITLIKPGIQKINPGKGRPPRNHFFKYVPKVWPKCNKLNVTTIEILATCKNTKIFYHRLRKDFWDIRCEQCKTTRILPFKSK
jgi:predicted nucleic-acid-binding Zn-ribbon protein|tara:strand:- start:5035 stop:5316 length:282 start_codon:yes stop_codon:yes gene_type:complete